MRRIESVMRLLRRFRNRLASRHIERYAREHKKSKTIYPLKWDED